MSIINSLFSGVLRVFNGGKNVMEPVEGIGFEDWVKANAKIAGGKTIDEAVKELGTDRPRWDRVNEEWLTRMKNDKSFTLSVKYASLFNSNAQGNLPLKKDFTEDTYPFEKYVEVMAAMDVLGRYGRDAQDVLKDFGLTTADYSNLSSYWAKKIAFDPFGKGVQMSKLIMEYREKYEKLSGGSNHGDIDF